MKKVDFDIFLKENRVYFDGAMGTAIQSYDLGSDDYEGKDGCPEILVSSRPKIIQSIHESYYRAGSHVVETDSFGGSSTVLGEYELQDQAYSLNKRAAELAAEVAHAYSRADYPRFVAGSIGPGLKLPSLLHTRPADIEKAYTPQIQGLLDGGADLLIIETSQDMLHARTVLRTAEKEFRRRGRRTPIILSVTIEQTGTMLVGSDMATVIHTFRNFPLTALGINCATGPADMADAIRTLHSLSPFPTFVMPNAGMPRSEGDHFVYDLNPHSFSAELRKYLAKYPVNIVGGCCGTTAEHIHQLIEGNHDLPSPGLFKAKDPEYSVSSLYSPQVLKVQPPPLLIGERTNATGSKKFREFLLAENWDAMVDVAMEQIAEGAHVLDVSLAWVGRDEKSDMLNYIRRLNTASTIPLQIDSTDPDVMEFALQHTAAKCILNSANLEDGEEKFDRVAGLAKEYGASLIMLTIDENGMAKSSEEKVRIARRMIRRAVDLHGLDMRDLIIDPLTFTLGSGDEDSRDLAVQTLNAIEMIKNEFPQVSLILGLSNVSFGLKPRVRHVLNTVMLSEAIQRGLDAAIVHAGKIRPLHLIPTDLQNLARDLIYDRRSHEDENPLMLFIQAFENLSSDDSENEVLEELSPEEALHRAIVRGDRKKILPALEKGLETHKPFDLINHFLLDGMKEVGELFGAGKMQLPFVLQSAETMKIAVNYLEPFMEKTDSRGKGSMLLATVKGDVHDIGKNLVDIVVSNNGYTVHNIGIKQTVENILQAMELHKPDVIGLSGLLVKSVQVMKENLEIFRDRGINIPVVLGGAALTRKYVENELRDIYEGPLYYAADAFMGLELMDHICSSDRSSLMAEMDQSREKRKARSAPAPSVNRASSEKPGVLETVPSAPFSGVRQQSGVSIDDCLPFMSWNTLFKGQWRLKRDPQWSDEQYADFLEKEGHQRFRELISEPEIRDHFDLKYSYAYIYCQSEDEKLHLFRDPQDRTPFVTWNFRRQRGGGLAIPDYFLSRSSGKMDILPLQVVTAGEKVVPLLNKLYEKDEYQRYLYLNGIFAEMAEALAEYTHARIRRELGFSGDEAERGKRYSFGYPACPDLEQQVQLMDILRASELGMTLSDEFQIHPEFSTSAFIVHHPEAKYFSV